MNYIITTEKLLKIVINNYDNHKIIKHSTILDNWSIKSNVYNVYVKKKNMERLTFHLGYYHQQIINDNEDIVVQVHKLDTLKYKFNKLIGNITTLSE